VSAGTIVETRGRDEMEMSGCCVGSRSRSKGDAVRLGGMKKWRYVIHRTDKSKESTAARGRARRREGGPKVS
jgi:hypothetical protein